MPTSTSRFMNGSSGSAYQSAARRCSPLSSSSSPSSSPFSSASSVSSSSSNSAATTAKLSALDSVFYQPKRWQSWYVKKLTCDLSIERHRASRAQQSKTVSAVAVQSRDYSYRYSNNYSSPSRQSSAYSTSTSSSSTRPQAASTMIKARHQFSTIRTSYSDVQKSFVSDVNPLRAMLVQVDFEVFGDVSGLSNIFYSLLFCFCMFLISINLHVCIV